MNQFAKGDDFWNNAREQMLLDPDLANLNRGNVTASINIVASALRLGLRALRWLVGRSIPVLAG